jgi:hypothetical protein
VQLLPDDVAEDTALLQVKVAPAPVDLLLHLDRHDGQRDELRMGMLEGRSGGQSLVLEDQRVLESAVLLQVLHPVAVGPEHLLHRLLGQTRKGGVVVRRFDDDLVSADAVHLVEDAFALFVEIPFDLQGRELVRHDAKPPARPVRLSVLAVRERFMGRSPLVPGVEGAEAPAPFAALVLEIGRPLSPFRRNDDPAAGDRVFP